ncbi:arabinosyltransferase domain-containing protein [Rhodococcus sp. NPDC058514]|uniref:arabinosyltransferase domain-containing protein n=1 Tax=unclassified Rhodococcus (in: high G+C Gram-positive bacteria) TaxID=192944 RepID=UPI003668E7D4
MTDTAVADRRQSDPSDPVPLSGRDAARIRIVAGVASVLAVLAAVSVPFLPVQQQTATLSWPQADSLASIDSPLVSYAPLEVDVSIPAAAAQQLSTTGGVVISTAPVGAADAARYGLVARVNPGTDDAPARLDVTARDQHLLSIPVDDLAGRSVTVTSNPERTTTTVTGSDPTTLDGDFRPQMVGVFTELQGPSPAGLTVNADIDTRFSSSPSAIKLVAMIVAVLATAVALVALHRIDNLDGRRSRRFLPARWWKLAPIDVVVIGTLVLWHFIGSTTSDDGYQFTMARASLESGYMANYFRWFGVPEAPFGTPYYDLLALMTTVSTASPWVRLPALIAGIVCWLVISREVAPRLGVAVGRNRLALWTGGLVFLAFWLPYNNGLRPEPIVAAGVLLTWCSVERAIATRRLLPAAVAVLVGALTVTVGPSGIICFGALIAGARPVLQIVSCRAKTVGYVAAVGPIVAAGLAILVAAFADQTLAAVVEMQRVHAIPPSTAWFEEYKRYEWLFNINADGSLARRFGVFVMVLSIVTSLLVMLRRGGRIPGTASGPSRRIIGITAAAMVLMMFTPTKWTHHFGVFAGLAGSLAVLTAVAVGPLVLRSRRNRALFAAAVLFLLALAFTSSNSWWYVSRFGIPWWDKPVMIAGFGAGTILLGLTGVTLLVAGWCFLREPHEDTSARPGRLWSIPPLTVAAAAMVAFFVLSMTKGAVAQYPSFSLAKSNLGALAGHSCGLAEDVLVETDTNASMLRPLTAAPANALGAQNVGFTPNGVAADLTADEEASSEGMATSLDNEDAKASDAAGTAGGQGAVGINGSTVALPFGLDPATTPVLGTYGANEPAGLTSDWYALPAGGDLVSMSVAGQVYSVDADSIATPGARVELDYGVHGGDGTVQKLGSALPIDIGPAPSWRNLRVPLDELPAEANAVRIVVEDTDTRPDQWLAVTPPRVPQTRTLDDVIGSQTPTMIDWAVALQFPCQQPFNHRLGVAEIPEYRILPDRPAAVMTSLWQDHFGGGPLGWIDLTATGRTLPTYLDGDWGRDWGTLEKYSRIDPNAVPAQLDTDTVRRSGTWSPGAINIAW